MRHITLSILASCFIILAVVPEVEAQVKRYAMLEHFTQASCAPCAVQNPAFFGRFYDNQHRAHIIAYHTYWPGFDPMYEANEAEQDAMISHYSISSVPNTVLNGERIGLPNQVTNELMRNTLPSNFRVLVSEEDDPDEPGNRKVSVTVETVGEPDRDELRLRVAAVERLVTYPSPPGSNGERVFPYVFRRFVAGSSDGVLFDVPPQGQSAMFEYSFPMDAEWDEKEILCVAYVADRSTREVLNSGVMGDPTFEIAASSGELYKQSADTVTFEINLIELAQDTSEVTITLDYEPVPGWEAYFTYDGETYIENATVTAEPGISVVRLEIVTDGSPNKNTYRFDLAQVGSEVAETIEFQVVSPVEDLFVYNDEEFVVPSQAVDLESILTSGRLSSEVSGSIVVSTTEWIEGLRAEVFSGVKNIYLNTGWTFPPLTEEMIDALDTHLDDGGNLLIAGQDIGQYIMNGGAPTSFRAFFFNTLNAQLQDNGNASLATAEINDTDPIFGDMDDLNIERIYSANYTRPDVLRSRNGSQPVYYYNGENDKIAALRSENGESRILYLGFGLEQIENEELLGALLTRAQEWFNGEVTTSVDQQVTLDRINWDLDPNPANSNIWLTVPDEILSNQHFTYEILNAYGSRVKSGDVNSLVTQINVGQLPAGIYSLRLSSAKGVGMAKKLFIQR